MPLSLPIVAGLLACAERAGEGPTKEPPIDPAVELGTGETAFEALADGDEVFVVQGPQGGFHVNGSLRAQGIEPGDTYDLGSPFNPTVTFTVFREEEELARVSYTQGLDATDDSDVFEMVGRRVILSITSDDEVVGDTLAFEVAIVDAEGTEVRDARSVVAVADPRNP